MGYYSEVALVLSYYGNDILEKYMDTLDQQTSTEVEDFFSDADVFHYTFGGELFFLWKHVKWYDHDPKHAGPYHIAKFLQTVPSGDCLFIRLGDGLEDATTYGEMWSNPFGVNLLRRIEHD